MCEVTSARSSKHWLAVFTIAMVAIVFGFGFATMQTVLRGGLSVGSAITLRFFAASLIMGLILLVRGKKLDSQSVRDGCFLGLILVSIFWIQTDGLRFTTTSKSAFITSLYVPFTPLLALALGNRVRLHHAVGAVLATIGLLLLVHLPGGMWSGWNRGDFEMVVSSVLCAGHLTATSHFARRSDGWVLAFVQMAVTFVVSLAVTACLPGEYGFRGTMLALTRTDVLLCMAFMIVLNSVFAFWAQSTMQAHLSPTEAAIAFSLEPVVAGFVGVMVVGEKLTLAQLGGAALILAGMLAAELMPRYLYRDPVKLAEAESEALD